VFKKDKDYIFSFGKYRADCARMKIQIGDWAQPCNGAKVLIKRDYSQGLIHGDIVSPDQIVMMMGKQMRIRGSRERVRSMVEPEWCEEK
jgi:hypothetical protein